MATTSRTRAARVLAPICGGLLALVMLAGVFAGCSSAPPTPEPGFANNNDNNNSQADVASNFRDADRALDRDLEGAR